MKLKILMALTQLFVGIVLGTACTQVTNSSNLRESSSAAVIPVETQARRAGPTNSQVEAAVMRLLDAWRFDGSITVLGIREIPQQNSAVADLKFNAFQFAVNGTDQLIKAKDFKPPKKSGQIIPSYEEMFPPKKITYSKQGRATLTKYNDGRWILKQVNWHDGIACCGITGNIEIR